MNGRKAKELRRQAYGDTSQREERKYYKGSAGRSGRRPIVNGPSTPRAVYQRLKKAVYQRLKKSA